MSGYRFTDRVRKALRLGREEAARLNHEAVGTEHMLLGIVREGEGVASAVLLNLGADPEDLVRRIEAAIPQGRSHVPPNDLPFTARAKKALELALSESRDLGYNDYVDTAVVLLGLLRESEGVAGRVLRDTGLRLPDARAELLRLQPPESLPPDDDGDGDDAHPTFEKVKAAIRNSGLRDDRLTILADLDALPPEVLVDLMAGLDALHRAWGGAGLRLDAEHVGKAAAQRVPA